MRRRQSIARLVFLISSALTLSVAFSSLGFAGESITVNLTPGDDVQSFVNKSPAGTTFLLAPGTYRMQSVVPKSGDSFIGQGTVVFNGSEMLSFQPDSANKAFWIASAVASKFFHGGCQKSFPLCGYSQDLFIDNRLQTPAQALEGLRSGSWYFDRTKNIVYIPSNPIGHAIELGMTSYAFSGGASNVHIQSLIVEKYACPAQYGAVGGDSSGSMWVASNVESRWNHGRGISLGTGSQITHSFIHHNGQLGISLYGDGSLAANNEISWNNYAGFDPGWEAGGSKFSRTSNLKVQSNYVHDNLGRGLWTDGDNVGTLYENNVVANNLLEGIAHEISFKATIRNNTVKGNGTSPTVWLWNSQILIQNSSNVEVYGNTIEVPATSGNGIGIINQNRGAGTLGTWIAANNFVHDNTVIMLGKVGESGLADDTHGDSAKGNEFDHNRYIIRGGGDYHWTWLGYKDWSGFKKLGEEAHGNCCN